MIFVWLNARKRTGNITTNAQNYKSSNNYTLIWGKSQHRTWVRLTAERVIPQRGVNNSLEHGKYQLQRGFMSPKFLRYQFGVYTKAGICEKPTSPLMTTNLSHCAIQSIIFIHHTITGSCSRVCKISVGELIDWTMRLEKYWINSTN